MTEEEKLSVMGFMELALGRGVSFIVAWQGKGNIEILTTMSLEALAHSVATMQKKLEKGEVDITIPMPDYPA